MNDAFSCIESVEDVYKNAKSAKKFTTSNAAYAGD